MTAAPGEHSGDGGNPKGRTIVGFMDFLDSSAIISGYQFTRT